MHNQIGRRPGQDGQPFGAQFGRRLETAVGQQVVFEKAIDRTGDVAADRIDGFIFAAETVGTARIDEMHVRRFNALHDRIDIHQPVLQQGNEYRR